MKKPKMIMFDYGQTLVWESPYDLEKTFADILAASLTHPRGVTPQSLAQDFRSLRAKLSITPKSNQEPSIRCLFRYMAESAHLEFDASYTEIEEMFWKGAVEFGPTPGIGDFLDFLEENDIRKAVISNLDYRESTLETIIRENIPGAMFEFTIATSEYLFRKPFPEIFRLGLIKAGLEAKDVWYVGNDAVYDVEGAYNAGLFPVWYKGSPYFSDQQQPPSCPYVEIKDWSELAAMIRQAKK